jgi:hypothetical protein
MIMAPLAASMRASVKCGGAPASACHRSGLVALRRGRSAIAVEQGGSRKKEEPLINHDSLGRSLRLVGNCLSSEGQFAAAQPWCERAIKAKEQGDIHGRVDHASLGRSLHLVGDCLSNQGQFAAAQPWFERARRKRPFHQ